jgi:hypothetical protein
VPHRAPTRFTLEASSAHALTPAHALTTLPASHVPLRYVPENGRAAEDWWGDAPLDMSAEDELVPHFDTAPLAAAVEVIGNPHVSLRYRPRACLAHVIARLEDVAPDGRVTLVTGGARNGFQLANRTAPAPPPPGQLVTLDLPLHFTTWTFGRGHRIRLVVTHAQFPMLWPTPELTTSALATGTGGTALTLPVAEEPAGPPPAFPPPEPLEERPDSEDLPGSTGMQKTHGRDPVTGHPWFRMRTDYGYRLGPRRYRVHEQLVYRTDPGHPADSRADGEMTTAVDGIPRPLLLETRISIRSDARAFHVEVCRALTVAGRRPVTRTWREAIPRDGH